MAEVTHVGRHDVLRYVNTRPRGKESTARAAARARAYGDARGRRLIPREARAHVQESITKLGQRPPFRVCAARAGERGGRNALAELALSAEGGLFPVQTLRLKPERAAIEVHERLRARGIETVLHRVRDGSGPRLSFIFTARHRRSEIDRAVAEVQRAVDQMPQPITREKVHANANRS